MPLILLSADGDLVQIVANTAVEHQIGVAHRVVMQQLGQFGSLSAVPCDLVFDRQTVDADPRSVGVAQLHGLRILVILAADQLPHGVPPSIFSHFSPFDPLRMRIVEPSFSVNMYYSSPILLAKSNIEKLNFCHFSNVVCDGS